MENKVYYEKLKGLKMYAIGDSVFNGNGIGREKSYPSLLARKYEMEHINDGVSGSTIAVFPDYPPNKIPMVLRYKDTLPEGDVDIILLEGGANDRSIKIPIGEVDSKDINTFAGGLNLLLDGLRERFPKALIICATMWKRVDLWHEGACGDTQEYIDKMIEICAARNIPCINMSDVEATHINLPDPEFRLKYSINPDDIGHLNEEGMKLVLPYAERKVAEFYYEFMGEKL